MIIQRLYTKVLLPGGSKDIKDLSDKQLENISKYGSTDAQKKNILKNGAKLAIASGVTGGGLDALLFGLNGKTAAKSAAVGLAAGSGIALYGHHRNKKLAKEAKEELERRKKQKNYSRIEAVDVPSYKTFLKENPKAMPVDKFVRLFPRVLQLSRKYKICDGPYEPVADVEIPWNDWVRTEEDLVWREYYPMLSWPEDYYHSDLYYHIPTSTWVEIDGDSKPKDGFTYKTPLDWIAYHTYILYQQYSDYPDKESLEKFFNEFCKLVGLNWERVKKGGPDIIQGRYDPKNPTSTPKKQPKLEKPNLGSNIKNGVLGGALAGYLGGRAVSKFKGQVYGSPSSRKIILGGAAIGSSIGAGIGAYKYYKDLQKYKNQKNYSDDENAKMTIQDIFIVGGKVVATGKVEQGTFRVGDKVKIDKKKSTILEIRQFKKTLREATKGMNIGILLDNINKNDVHRGMIIEK